MNLMELTALAICEAGEHAKFDAALAAAVIAQDGPTPAMVERLRVAMETLEVYDRPEKWLTLQVAAWCDADGVVCTDKSVLVGVA